MIAIRPAELSDLPALSVLMSQLGYSADARALEAKLTLLRNSDTDELLVADRRGVAVGLIALHVMEMLPSGRLGRITAMVVADNARRQGIGNNLLEAADAYFRAHHCVMLEVTSGEHRIEAHAFYRAGGYAEKRHRFVKRLTP